MAKIFLLSLPFFFFGGIEVASQTNVPPPQVINAAGGSVKLVGGNYYGYNIGEPVTGTANTGSNYYTQGFLQPDYKIGSAFNASIYFTNESCQGAGDGSIIANPYNNVGPVKYSITPSPSPADTTSAMVNLPPGTYYLTITDSMNRTIGKTITIAASNEICPVTIHHAFSPNGDGLNDTYIMDGIQNYPNNHVYIFNRWGQKIWEAEKYDNVKVVWKGTDSSGKELNNGTYFYIIDKGDGKKPLKDWVELTK